MEQDTKQFLDIDGTRRFKELIFANIPTTKIVYATFTSDGWIGDAAPYVQTVLVDGIAEGDDIFIDRDIDYSATAEYIDKYNIGYSYIANGAGKTINSGIEYKVFNKPTIDIRVAISFKK